MLSVHPISSTGSTLAYFAQDNYYTVEQGLEDSCWWGQGASQLGWQGPICAQDFQRALNGRFGQQELGRQRRVEGSLKKLHQPGLDLTFSAPKSVSLLAEVAGVKAVRLAHEKAVQHALTYVEQQLAITRCSSEGQVVRRQTQSLVVALFCHQTSRRLDPQTHTHALVMNATHCSDGRWRSLVNHPIYQSQLLIGSIYRSELARELTRLGYALRSTGRHGQFEIQGITPEQLAHFSQRREDIRRALEKQGLAMDQASSHQKELASLSSRAPKTACPRSVLQEAWRSQASQLKIDFERLMAAAQERARQCDRIPNTPDRITAVRLAMAHVFEREVVVRQERLLTCALNFGTGRVSISEVLHEVQKLKVAGELIDLGGQKLTSKRLLASERHTVNQLREPHNRAPAVLEKTQAAQALRPIESQQGFAYSPEQRNALEHLLTTPNRILGLQAGAGAGKTTLLHALASIAQQQGYSVRGLAPTALAARLLREHTGIACSTVSGFLLSERPSKKEPSSKALWIVDESSFLSQLQHEKLDRLSQKAAAKLVYVGDVSQLQAVEAGKPFALSQKNGLSMARLQENHRPRSAQLKAAVSPFNQTSFGVQATEIRQVFERLDQLGCVHEVKGDGVEALLKAWLRLDVEQREQTLVMTLSNRDRHLLNARIRAALKQEKVLLHTERPCQILWAKGWTQAQIQQAHLYQAGDWVRFGRDYRSLGIEKGTYAQVQGIHRTGSVRLQTNTQQSFYWRPHQHSKVEVYTAESRGLTVGDWIRITRNHDDFKNGEVFKVQAIHGDLAHLQAFDQKENRSLHLANHPHWDHAYAVTVHAAQGCTQQHAVLYLPSRDGAVAHLMGQRSFYVSATRAREHFTIYTDHKQHLLQAIQAPQDKTSALDIRTTPTPTHPAPQAELLRNFER